MSSILIEKATEYIGYGLSVIPIKSDKSPAINRWTPFKERKMINGEIQNHFSHSNAAGIGIVCGPVSGNLEVLDIDLKYDKTGSLEKEFIEIFKQTLPEIFNTVTVVRTINKGLHIYYRYETDKMEGNQKLANNEDGNVLFETRAEGGYVVAPGTAGYELISQDLSKIPTISKEDRDTIISISSIFDESNDYESNDSYNQEYEEDSVFDDFNTKADVLKLLADYSWVKVGQKGDNILYRRPGKEKGISATWDVKRRIFYNFSTSADLEANKGYSATGIYGTLVYGGNFSAAKQKLLELGFGKTTEIQVTRNTPPTPRLPIEGFPESLQRFILTASEVLSVPRDFFAGGVIMATALGIGDKLELVTKFRNVPNLWMCIVGDVSVGKTEPINICLKPLANLDAKLFKEYNDGMNEFYRLSKLNKAERLAEGVAVLIRPKRFQYLISDYTPEALAKVHSINKRGLLISRDELKGLLDDFGRYNKSGEESAMLSSYNQVDININRKNSDDIFIRKPVISMIGGLQPNILPSLSANNREENGFLARFCFVYPDNSKRSNYIDKSLPAELVDDYEAFIIMLTNWSSKMELFLTKEAQSVYEVFYNNNSALINDEAAGYLKGVYGKLDIIALRMAVVIKGMNVAIKDDKSNMITEDIMKSAIEITEYFRATALKVYRKIFGNDEKQATRKEVIEYFFHVEKMSKSEIARILNVTRQRVQNVLRQ